MPLINGYDLKGPYFQFGPGGKRYHYKAYNKISKGLARSKAMKQGRAMAVTKYGGFTDKKYRVKIFRSPRKDKKWRAQFENNKTVDFGATGYSDYTIHKDPERKKRYIARHRNNEDWTINGIFTPGWWSRYYLWEKPTKKEAKIFIENQFPIEFY